MPITASLLGLNPYVDKEQLQYLLRRNNRVDYSFEICEARLVNHFIFDEQSQSIENFLKKQISSLGELRDNWNGMETKKISPIIINNSLKIVDAIPPSFLEYLSADKIYPTKFGTIIFDFDFGNDENILSLEIAKNSIGYFYEKTDGKSMEVDYLDIRDSISFDNSMITLIEDLSIFA